MTKSIPLTSHEVRWFFEGKASQTRQLMTWFESDWVDKNGDVGRPIWKSRVGDQPDLYLLMPHPDDMSIKWREGELQVKGRVSSVGTLTFCGMHQGRVERWIKWSYRNLAGGAYERLFASAQETGLAVLPVRKTRALRKIRLDTMTGTAQEVNPKTFVDRGVGIELVDIIIDRNEYGSLGFEAFPNDSGMDESFFDIVESTLKRLKNFQLTQSHSLSYPAFLKALPSLLNRSTTGSEATPE